MFEGSDYPDFRTKDTLFTIKELPLRMHNVVYPKKNGKKYRYVRYYDPAYSHCNIAEAGFFANNTDSIRLKGKCIGTSNGANGNGAHDFSNAYDEISRAQALHASSEIQQIAAEKSEEAQKAWNILWLSLASVGFAVILLYKEYWKQKKLLTENIQSTNRKYTYILLQYHRAVEELNALKSNKQHFVQKKEEEIEQLRQVLASYR